jgi:hypothetical protein
VEEEQLAALRRWGEGLRLDGREEVRAAGKAITLLCDEVARLELDLWHARTRPGVGENVRDSHDAASPEGQTTHETFDRALRRRLFGDRR